MAANNCCRKPHAVCVPFPSQGHLTPMMQLAKILHAKGFHITFVNTEFTHRRLIRSQGPGSVEGVADFRYETIPDGLPPPSDPDANQYPPELCDSIRKTCLGPFRELLVRLNSCEEVMPPVSCIISDGMMSFGTKAGQEFGVPSYQLWTASACGFMGYLHYPELIKRGIAPFKDESFKTDGSLDENIDWIPGMKNMRLGDLPSFIRTTNPDEILFNYLKDETQSCLNSSGIIMNTFTALESEVLQAIASKHPHVYAVGSLSVLEKNISGDQSNSSSSSSSSRASLWREESACLEWLDKQEPNSVIYVNFGSLIKISDDQLEEFAWGLADSKRHFLWILRNDSVRSGSAVLPDGFLEETKDRGVVAKWCQQEEVLSHRSVGVFLSHCGWNSVLESVCAGVPLICWGPFAEQTTNRRYICREWGIGVEVGDDPKRDEIERLVRIIMEEDTGEEIRRRALEWKMEAEAATVAGGSSYEEFDRFLKEV